MSLNFARNTEPTIRVLLTGWFSFSSCDPTAGDHETKEIIIGWLRQANIDFDVLLDLSEKDIISFFSSATSRYSHLIVACGPYRTADDYQRILMQGLPAAIKVGVNLSMIGTLDPTKTGFKYLFERDSSQITRADLSFGLTVERVPVVGLMLVGAQTEYGGRGRHQAVNSLIEDWLAGQDVAVLPIDTKVPRNEFGLNNFAQIESVISKMDLVVTTRLHGLVLALKNHIPAIVIDPITGGAKVSAQARRLGWPMLIKTEELSKTSLDKALHWCREDSASILARICSNRASLEVQSIGAALLSCLGPVNTKSMIPG
jgi:hypothetical protein